MISLATDPLQQIAQELNDDLKTLADLERHVSKQTIKMNKATKIAAKPYLKKINKLKKEIQFIASRVAATATDHRSLLTEDNTKKTISLQAGTISWRDSTSLIFDMGDVLLLALIRQLRGMKRFVTWKPTIEKQAIKKDEEFVAQLIKRDAAHFDYSENMTIKPFVADGTVIKDDNPYKITYPREE